MRDDPALAVRQRQAVTAARGVGWLLIGLAAWVLFGWAFDWEVAKRIQASLASMKANSALCLGLLGVGLVLVAREPVAGPARAVATVAVAVAVLLSGASLLQDVLTMDLGIDQMLFADRADPEMGAPGRMSLTAAVATVLLGVALLLLDARGPERRLPHLLAVVTGAIGFLGLIGYSYDVEEFYEQAPYSSLALHNALGLVAAAFGVLAARPTRGLMRVVLESGVRGALLRRILPVALLGPVLLGGLTVLGREAGLYSASFETALYALITAAVISALVWWTGGVLRRGEEAAEAHRQWLGTVLASIGDAVIAVDADDRVVLMNPVAAELTGWSEAQSRGLSLAEVVRLEAEDTGAPIPPPTRRALNGQRAMLDGPTVLRRRDGRLLAVDDTAAPIRDAEERLIGSVMVFRDVSERRRAERALQESETQLRVITDAIPAFIAYVDADERLQYVNAAYERAYGVTREETRGRALRETLKPETHARLRPFLQRALNGERTEVLGEFDTIDGPRTFKGIFVPDRDPDTGEVHGFFGMFSDVTELEEARRELADLNATLERRVETRAALAEARAAQLRHLAVELTQAEHRERRRLATTLHDHLQQILVAAKIRGDVLSQRIAAGDLRPLAQQMSGLLAEAIEASRTLTVELSPPVLYERGLTAALRWLGDDLQAKHGLEVHVEVEREVEVRDEGVKAFLFQSVRELLFNVVKHAKTHEAWVKLSAGPADHVRITVSDQGRGCASEDLVRRPGEAAGFGLFNIQQRLDLLGGRFEAEGRPGVGCTVTLDVPLPEAPAEPPVRAVVRTPVPAPRTDGRTRVLLVDDHEILREGIAGLMEAEPDIELVGEASDGLQAVHLAHTLAPDVIVMDISLPGMDGVEATRVLHRELPEIRIIGLSMHDERAMADAMLEAGAEAYLTKGGHIEDLMAVIRGGMSHVPPGDSPETGAVSSAE